MIGSWIYTTDLGVVSKVLLLILSLDPVLLYFGAIDMIKH